MSFYVESSRFYIIDYTTVPAVLTVIFAYVYMLMTRERTVRARSVFIAGLTGLVMALVLFAKITSGLVVVVPVVGIVIMAGFGHPQLRAQIILAAISLMAFAAIVSAYFFGLWLLDFIDSYLLLLAGQGKTHSASRMLKLVPGGWWLWFPLGFASIILSYTAAMRGRRSAHSRRTGAIGHFSWPAHIVGSRFAAPMLGLCYVIGLTLCLLFILYNFEDCGFDFNLLDKKCLQWRHFLDAWIMLTVVTAGLAAVLYGRAIKERLPNSVRFLLHNTKIRYAFIFVITIFVSYSLASNWEIFLIIGVAATCLALNSLHPFQSGTGRIELAVMAWVALAMPFVNGLGSGAGLFKMTYGLWLLAALLPILIREALSAGSLGQWKDGFHIGFVAFLMAATFAGWQQAYGQVFGDDDDRSKLTYELESPRLANIYTTAGRKQSFDALITAVRSFTSDGDEILAYNYLSMVHFSANTRPLYATGWSVLNGVPAIYYDQLDRSLCVTKFPKIIVRSLTIPFSNNWGLNPNTKIYNAIFEEDYRYTFDVVDTVVRQNCDARVVWENPDFQILVPGASGERSGG